MSIKIESLHHAGFLVSDIDRAAAFYEGLLGLVALPRPDFGFRGRWYDIGTSQQLHLMESEHPQSRTDRANFDRHIALTVSDVEETAKQLEEMGVEVARGSNRSGRTQLFVRDPDGNMIEFR